MSGKSLWDKSKALNKEDMQKSLKDMFGYALTEPSKRRHFQYNGLGTANALKAIREVVLEQVAKYAHENVKDDNKKENVKDDNKKAKPKSIHFLIVDLGQGLTDCVSLQAYLSVVVFLFWAAQDVLDFITQHPTSQDPISHVIFETCMKHVFRTYVALVLLIESKIKSLKRPQIWLDIPFGELDRLVKDRLPIIARDELIGETHENHLAGKSFAYSPDGTPADANAFAQAMAKMMLADKKGGSDVVRILRLGCGKNKQIKSSNLAPELQGPVGSRNETEKMQLEEGKWVIVERDGKTIVSRLVEERWIQCINDRAGFVFGDLLSRTSIQDESKNLAKIVNERLATLPNVKKPEDAYGQDRHWHVFPLIQDLGTVVGSLEREELANYIRANLYLFWAAAAAWSTFPDDDSWKKIGKRVGMSLESSRRSSYETI